MIGPTFNLSTGQDYNDARKTRKIKQNKSTRGRGCFWARKDGHFWQKCPNSGTKKWHFGCPNENSKTTFISPTSPKNDKFHLELKVLSVLSGFWEEI